MALQNQLLFNLDEPLKKGNMAIRYHRPQPVVVEKCESEPIVPNVCKISQQVAKKFNAIEFVAVSTDTLDTAVQLARRDMKKQKTLLPKAVDPVEPTADRQQAQKVVGHVIRRQSKQKGDSKKVSESTRTRSVANKCKIHKTDDINPAPTSSPPTRDTPDHHRRWMEEVVCMCEEMDCCLTKIRQLEETARSDPPRRFQIEEPGERQKRLIRIEEQKTRSTRILYTLSQKLREIDVTLARRPKLAKRNHLLRQLAAISRSSIRALHEFVQHLRDFNLAEGMPRIYDNLVVLLSQIIECFERLNPNSLCLKDEKLTDAANAKEPTEENHVLGDGDQHPSQLAVPQTYNRKKKNTVHLLDSLKSKSLKAKEPVVEESHNEKPIHPLSLLRQKYPAAYHHLPNKAPSEVSIITGYSSSHVTSVVSPVSHSIPIARSTSRNSYSQQSIQSLPSMHRPHSPSPTHLTDQLEELLEGHDDLPSLGKEFHTHTPWVLEPEIPHQSRHSMSPRLRDERRQSPDPRYADPTISSVKKHSASVAKFEPEPVRGRKQKAHTGAKQRSSSKSDTAGFSSQEDERKTDEPETVKTPQYNSDIVTLRNEMNKYLSRLIGNETEKKKKIKILLEEGKDHMNIDQLTEMILHEIMVDPVSQLSTTISDDDTESNASPTQCGVSAENILQRLDTIEAEQNQIRQRWDNLQYKAVENNHSKINSHPEFHSDIPRPIHFTGHESFKMVSRPVKPGFSKVKMSKSVSSATSSNFRSAVETQPTLRYTSSGRTIPGPHLLRTSGYGHSANNNNSHLVAVPMSKQLVASIINNQQQFQRYLKQSANMKVGRFDPWKVVDEVSEEILDACVTEVCDELEQFNSDIANHIYSSEFASESSTEMPEDLCHQVAWRSTSPDPLSISSARSSGVSRNLQSDSRGHILERNWSPVTGSSVKNLK